MTCLRASVTRLFIYLFISINLNLPFPEQDFMQRNLEMWTQGHFTPLLLCFCLIASIDRPIVESEVFRVKSAAEVNSQGHPLAIFIARATMASAHGVARGSPAAAPAWKGVPRSAPLSDCHVSCIMAKLSFCNAQMRLSLVLQLLTGSRRDAVSNRGSICCGMRLDLALPVYSVHLTMN